MLRSIFIASISMLVRIHALRVGNRDGDNTVTLKVEATDLTDSLYTLVQHMSDWNFGPELCLSDKCGTHLFSGYTLRDYNITDGDWIIAGHGTRQPFSPQPWTTLRRVTTPTTTTTARQLQPQLTYDSASYDASQIAPALMRSAVASPRSIQLILENRRRSNCDITKRIISAILDIWLRGKSLSCTARSTKPRSIPARPRGAFCAMFADSTDKY